MGEQDDLEAYNAELAEREAYEESQVDALAEEMAAAISPCLVCGQAFTGRSVVKECGDRWGHADGKDCFPPAHRSPPP